MRCRKIIITVLCVILSALCSDTFADPFDDVIDWDGRLEVGVAYIDKGFGRSFIPSDGPRRSYIVFNDEIVPILKVELDYTIKVAKRIKVSFDIEGDLNDLGLEIEKGYVQFDISKQHRLRVGNMKKEFGIEERMGSDDLYAVNRSLLNRYIESFGILGRDISFQWRVEWEQSSQRHFQLYTVGGVDASERVFLNNASELRRVWGNIVMSNMLAYHREQLYDLVNIGYWINLSQTRFEIEMFAGKDPNVSVVNRELGIDRNAWFAAARVLWARDFLWGENLIAGVQPVVMASFVMPQIDKNDDFLIQLLPGINVLFDSDGDVRWMTDLELILARNPQTGKIGRLSHGIYTQIQVSW